MPRKLNRDEIKATNAFLQEAELRQLFTWQVYEEYEVVAKGVDRPYLRARKRSWEDTPRKVRSYLPLVDKPHLFLEFARIANQKDPGKVLEDWIDENGLLGLNCGDASSVGYAAGRIYRPEKYPRVVWPPAKYSAQGGPGETFDGIWEQAQLASHALTLYEATLSRDEHEIERVLHGTEDREMLEEKRRRFLDERRRDQSRPDADYIDILVYVALTELSFLIESPLMAFAHPVVNITGAPHRPKPSLPEERVFASWRPRNLLGAMYLQFYWNVAAGDVTRCKHCGNIIFHTPPIPQNGTTSGRKPRSDKEYCNRQCYENHYYHTKRKPQQLSRGSEG